MKKSKGMTSIRMKSMPIENSIQNEKQPSNVFLTKPSGKCTQPNKTLILSDSKCT